MATYEIVCVNTEHAHSHITNVGTGDDPKQASKIWTVAGVRAAIDGGDRFYTVSANGDKAYVAPYDCDIDGCKVATIRSAADPETDDNLDNLRTCRSAK